MGVFFSIKTKDPANMEENNPVSYKYIKERLEEVNNGSLRDFLHMWYKLGSTKVIHSKYLEYLGNICRDKEAKRYNTTKSHIVR